MDTKHYAISIGRELGSGGKNIGEIMAKKLGIPLYDNRLLTIAAKESGFNVKMFKDVDENVPEYESAFANIMHVISSPLTSLGNLYNTSMSRESLFQMQSDIIYEKAKEEDCIIIGRCSDYILRTHPRFLKIFIFANKEDRIKSLCTSKGINEDQAIRMISNADKERAEYHDFFCETNWGECKTYDICINSSLLGIENTADFLLDYAKNYLKI